MTSSNKPLERRKNMPADIKIAQDILEKATKAIKAGSNKHGDTYPSFKTIAELWSVYIDGVFTLHRTNKLQPSNVAAMMSMVKIVRALYGDSIDNYVDEAGYAALNGMLSVQGQVDEENDD